MTDKLVEAIKWTGAACDSGLMLEVNVAKDIVDAARAYHALPVVDAVQFKCLVTKILKDAGIPDLDALIPGHKVADHLRATYPDGLRWAE